MAIGGGSRSGHQRFRRDEPRQRWGQIARIGLPALLVLSIAAITALVFASFISHTTTSAASEAESEPSPIEVIAEHGVGDGYPATEVPIGNVTDVAADAAGNVYFVDNVHLRVRRIDAEGIIETVFNGHSMDVPSSPRAVALDPQSGALYVADDRANRVWVIRDGAVHAFAGTGNYGLSGDGGAATEAQLRFPADIAVGSDGTVYIADMINHRIRAVATDGRIDTVAGELPPGVDMTDALASGSLFEPELIAAGDDGWLYVVDQQGRRLQRIVPNGLAEKLAPTATITGLATAADGRLLAVSAGQVLEWRDGVAERFAEADRSFTAVAPYGSDGVVGYAWREHRIYLVRRDGSQGPLAGNGTAGRFGDGGLANGASFTCYDVAVRSDGEILFSDPLNRRIAVIHEDGTIGTFAGGGDVSEAALLASPLGIATDSSGAVYVADRGAHRILKVNPDSTVATVAGIGTAGHEGDGGAATEAALDSPLDVAIAEDGAIFISDSGNQRIRRVDPSGVISTVATLDMRPRSLAIDADGNVVVAGFADTPLVVIRPSGEPEALETGTDRAEDAGGAPITVALATRPHGPLLAASGAELFFVTAADASVTASGTPHSLVLPSSITGMTVDPTGDLIFCDGVRQRILRIRAPVVEELTAAASVK
jgi:DNA-binding beta-propeller fold protein YncE